MRQRVALLECERSASIGDYANAARDFQWLGLNSITLQLLAFHIPFLCAFLMGKPSLRLTRLFAGIALLAIPVMCFGPASFEIVACLAFDVAIGFCVVSAVYVMMFRLNNAERLTGLLLHSLHYAFSLMLRSLIQNIGHYSLDYFIVYASAGFFALALLCTLCRIGKEDFAETTRGSAREDLPIEKPPASAYAVFALVALYNFFTSTLAGLNYNTLMSNLMAYGMGAMVAIAVIWGAHRWLRSGFWHVWNLFLAATTLGVFCAFGRTYAAHSAAQGLLSAGETFGLTATLYMVFGIGKRAGHITFYRVYCGISFLLALLPVLFLRLDLDALSQNTRLLSLGAIAICLLITVLIAPVTQRYLFTAEWAEALRQFDINLVFETIGQTEQPELSTLTPREREVCALLLCGKTMRQIGAELSISQSTVSFHCRRLYQKLGISSRVELFAKFSNRLTLSQ